MEKYKNKFAGLTIALSMLAAHFLMDIYKIGIKDGKATKVVIVNEQVIKK